MPTFKTLKGDDIKFNGIGDLDLLIQKDILSGKATSYEVEAGGITYEVNKETYDKLESLKDI